MHWAVEPIEQTNNFWRFAGCLLGVLLLLMEQRCQGPWEERPDLLARVLTGTLGKTAEGQSAIDLLLDLKLAFRRC